MLHLGTMQNMRNQRVVAVWHYTIIVVAPELKTNFSYIKTLIFEAQELLTLQTHDGLMVLGFYYLYLPLQELCLLGK